MSRSIALLSGKGGSGKTTFALTLANMLSSCKIKVLLIDCDLVTNGATYFYEHRLSGNKPVISFFDLLYHSDQMDSCSPLEIDPPYFSFIPSIRRISDDITDSHPFDDQIQYSFEMYYSTWKKTYDVILFDCSAGYSDVLRYVVPEADINLVVLEPDKVSMAAMRSLYLKLGPVLSESKFYQIFNKVRPEEIKEYQRREGSFFTSIGAIAFDWSIRDVFSVANVPTLDNAGVDFGMQLSNICNTLFEGDAYQKKLSRFGLSLALRKAEGERKETRESLIEYQNDGRKQVKFLLKILASLVVALGCLAMVAFFYWSAIKDVSALNSEFVLIPASAGMIVVIMAWFSDGSLSNKERKMKLETYDDMLKTQQERIDTLEKMIEETESQV